MAVAVANKAGNGKPNPKHNIEAIRQAFYERIAKRDMRPLWKVMDSIVTKEPASRCQPAVWHFDEVKSLVMESGHLITAEEAKRRVLILENPTLRGESRVTNTLFAGIQMILPGEVAPLRPSASCSRGRVPIRRWKVKRLSCRPVISSSPRTGRRTITAIRPRSRCSGSMSSTFRR
jgi:hypothetical protein